MEPADDQSYREREVVKGPWSLEEDDRLSSLVKRHGPRNWTIISQGIPGRSGKSCRLRWWNQLSPKIEIRPFTAQEDEFIIRAQAKHGNCWAMIARMLRARSDNAVKNHWNSTLKRRILANNPQDSNNAVKNHGNSTLKGQMLVDNLQDSDNAVKNHWNSTLEEQMLADNLQDSAKRQRLLPSPCPKCPDCDVVDVVEPTMAVATNNDVSTELSLSIQGTAKQCQDSETNVIEGEELQQEKTAAIPKELTTKLKEMVRAEVRNALNMGSDDE